MQTRSFEPIKMNSEPGASPHMGGPGQPAAQASAQPAAYTPAPGGEMPTKVIGTPRSAIGFASPARSEALAGLNTAIAEANAAAVAARPAALPTVLPNGWNYDTGEYLGEGIQTEDLPAPQTRPLPPPRPRKRAPRPQYPDEVKFADVYAHYDAYDAWRAARKQRARKRRQTLLTAALVGLSLVLTTGAAATGETAVSAGAALSMADFNVYQSGSELLDINDATNGAFWYSYAESYNLTPALLETARGVQIGDRDTAALAAYGALAGDIEYQTGHSANRLAGTGYQTWADSTQYAANYSVTFRLFTAGGKTETSADKIAALYANPSNKKELAEYGVTLLVQNGVVADIECYTHILA